MAAENTHAAFLRQLLAVPALIVGAILVTVGFSALMLAEKIAGKRFVHEVIA